MMPSLLHLNHGRFLFADPVLAGQRKSMRVVGWMLRRSMTTSLETGPADSLLSDFVLAWKTGSRLAKDLDLVMDRQDDFQETSF